MKRLLLLFTGVLFSVSSISQVSVVSQTNATCAGMCNGAVTLSITGGIMPYTIGTLGGPSSCTITPVTGVNSNTVTITGLCGPCLYNFIVQDASFTPIGGAPVTITSPPPIVVNFSVQNVCCNGQCNGTVTPFVTGGSAPYTYSWFPNNPTTGACAGTYDLCVTDANGCVKCATTQVTQPPPFIVTSSVTATSCSSCCNGQVNASASGGNPNYTYTLYPGSVTNTTGIFPNLCAGVYSVCSSDAGCCSSCIGVTVPTGSTTSLSNLNHKEEDIVIYPNPSNGSLDVRSYINISGTNYEIIDVLGKKIDSGKAEELGKTNALKENGVYFVILRNKEGSVISRKKIIIEK
jgi:hypothetical protein